MSVNIPLLRTAVEWVEHQATLPLIDREWDQEDWIYNAEARAADLLYYESDSSSHVGQVAAHCGTAYCVAGYVAQMHDPDYRRTTHPDDKPFVSNYAARLLGIDEGQADALFAADNSAEDIRFIAEQIAGEEL